MSPKAPAKILGTKDKKPKIKTGVCPKCKSVSLYTEGRPSCLGLYGMCTFCVANNGSIIKPTNKKLVRRK